MLYLPGLSKAIKVYYHFKQMVSSGRSLIRIYFLVSSSLHLHLTQALLGNYNCVSQVTSSCKTGQKSNWVSYNNLYCYLIWANHGLHSYSDFHFNNSTCKKHILYVFGFFCFFCFNPSFPLQCNKRDFICLLNRLIS